MRTLLSANVTSVGWRLSTRLRFSSTSSTIASMILMFWPSTEFASRSVPALVLVIFQLVNSRIGQTIIPCCQYHDIVKECTGRQRIGTLCLETCILTFLLANVVILVCMSEYVNMSRKKEDIFACECDSGPKINSRRHFHCGE